MKLKLFFAVLFSMIFILTSCSGESLQNGKTEKGTTAEVLRESDLTNIDSISVALSKEGVPEFMEALKAQGILERYPGWNLYQSCCYNVDLGPNAEKTSAKVFTFINTGTAFVYLDGKAYKLGESLGGDGLTTAAVCDFDNDGNSDILYTYSWGSGGHYVMIEIFNTKTTESTVIYSSYGASENGLTRINYCLSEYNTGTETRFAVYAASMGTLEEERSEISYSVSALAGTIGVEDGVPVFTPKTSDGI